MDWRQTLGSYGWAFESKCKCGGNYKETWRKGDNKVKVIADMILKLSKKGRGIGTWNINLLEEKIKGI